MPTHRPTLRPHRRTSSRRLVAVALALALVGVPSATSALAHGPAGRAGVAGTTLVAASAIQPGSVGRTHPRVVATYQATLDLDFGTRRIAVDSSAVITNTTGGPIDRIEFNTVAGPLGGLTLRGAWVDAVATPARRTDQTIVVPLGGILPEGATTTVRVRYGATLRTSLSGSSWLFTRANGIANLYRWLPWVSRETAFDRPNHGDPFVTATSPLVRVTVRTDRPLVIAATGDRTSVSADGLTQVFEARQVRDFTITAAPDFRTRSTRVGDTTIRTYYRSGTHAALILDAAADAFRAMEARLGDYPHPTFKVVQSAGGYGMESPALIWIPYGIGSANLRYLIAHETAHQWFYGAVGNDQARQPFADEAAADFVARSILGLRRSSRCSTGRLDLPIYSYSSACYYERIYIQGGNLLDDARKRMGSTRFWAALRDYVADQEGRLVANRTLLDALDDATSLDLGRLLFAARFPSAY